MIIFLAFSQAIPIERDDGGWHTPEGDEDAEINDEIEFKAAKAEVVSIPAKLKAVLKFGYDEGWTTSPTFGGYDFNEWIVGVFAHTQAHYKDPSLGTQVTFEVRFCCSKA